MERFDCAVIGAGIVGLAHALVAARAGLRTVVLERDARALGASIRNFGFITVTGQPAGDTWRRARRARDVWAEVAPAAGIPIVQRGQYVTARRPEALAVLRAFAAGPLGEGCRVLDAGVLPAPLRRDLCGALHSPHELRVDSRDALPRLAAHLAHIGVAFRWGSAVHAVEPDRVQTNAGAIAAPRIVVCPGADLRTLFPAEFARRRTTLCKLHMLRVSPPPAPLPAPVMGDLGLLRYGGYADLPGLPTLRDRVAAEQPAALAAGVHLIAVAEADGSLVVGDSHEYDDAPDPFQPAAIDALILAELSAVLDHAAPAVLERWIGIYPSGPEPAFIAAPMPGVRLVSVTSGTGASTAFGLAEDTFADLERDA